MQYFVLKVSIVSRDVRTLLGEMNGGLTVMILQMILFHQGGSSGMPFLLFK